MNFQWIVLAIALLATGNVAQMTSRIDLIALAVFGLLATILLGILFMILISRAFQIGALPPKEFADENKRRIDFPYWALIYVVSWLGLTALTTATLSLGDLILETRAW